MAVAYGGLEFVSCFEARVFEFCGGEKCEFRARASWFLEKACDFLARDARRARISANRTHQGFSPPRHQDTEGHQDFKILG